MVEVKRKGDVSKGYPAFYVEPKFNAKVARGNSLWE